MSSLITLVGCLLLAGLPVAAEGATLCEGDLFPWDAKVEIHEIVLLTGCFLRPTGRCASRYVPPKLAVEDLIRAVGNAQRGCPPFDLVPTLGNFTYPPDVCGGYELVEIGFVNQGTFPGPPGYEEGGYHIFALACFPELWAEEASVKVIVDPNNLLPERNRENNSAILTFYRSCPGQEPSRECRPGEREAATDSDWVRIEFLP